MDICRIGLIGAGNVGRRHAQVLRSFPDVHLAGITDVVPEAAAALARDVGCRPFPGTGELLSAGLDAVYVCVPPFAHGAPEAAVLSAGMPLFVEKPLAATAETAERVGAQVAAAGVLTAVGHHWRYLKVVERARRLLDGRAVRLVGGTWLDKVPPVGWWPVRDRSGGPVIEQAAHVLDLARLLAGEVAEVFAMGDGRPPAVPGADVDGVTTATLRFRSGALGTLSTTCLLGWKQRAGLELVAEGLWLSVGEDGLAIRDGGADPVEELITADPAAARVAVDRAFVDAVRGIGNDVRAPYAEALRTHRLACALASSAATGQPARPAARRRTAWRRRQRTPGEPMTEGTAAMAGARCREKTERNIVVEGPGRVAVRDEPRAPVPAGAFRVTTVFSGISAGTELSYVKGTNPFLSERWDPGLGLFVPGEPNAGYPVTRLGYMEVGTVAESRTPVIGVGGTVAMTYGHRTGYTGDPVADRVVPLPEDLDPLLGIYVAHMGPICANGLLHAAADLCGPDVRSLGDGVRGRRVVVVGAGVVALLTALLTRRHGAASVVVLDPTPGRRAVAEALGLESLDPEGPNDAAASLKTRWRHGPGDRGADVVFQCRGQPAALHLALRVARPQATVIDLAFYQEGAAELRLGAEFHHNGLAVRCAQIGRVPRGLAHTWDRERLSAETIDLLRADGTAIREHLITAVVPFEDAPELFADLAARRRHELQAVLAFDPSMAEPRPAAAPRIEQCP